MNSYFPFRLYQLRKEKGETQEELAKMFDMTRATLSAYEKGKIIPPYKKVVTLAEHFGVSVDYLLGQTDMRNSPENTPSDKDCVDVIEVLRTLEADVKDKSKICYLNGNKILERNRYDVDEVIKSIITILEKMQ